MAKIAEIQDAKPPNPPPKSLLKEFGVTPESMQLNYDSLFGQVLEPNDELSQLHKQCMDYIKE